MAGHKNTKTGNGLAAGCQLFYRKIYEYVLQCMTTYLSYQYSLKEFIIFEVSGLIYHFFSCNSVDPDQPPHSAASGLGLHCLPVSFL